MISPLLRVALFAALLIVATAATIPAQNSRASDDLLLGTWKVDLAASRYSPGPAVREETRIFIRDGEGIRGRIERVHADGRKETVDYRADVGHSVPVYGARGFDAIRLTRVDARTTEGVLSHAGRVFGHSRRTFSSDGRTMTITFRREEPGDMVNNVAVFRKQE